MRPLAKVVVWGLFVYCLVTDWVRNMVVSLWDRFMDLVAEEMDKI